MVRRGALLAREAWPGGQEATFRCGAARGRGHELDLPLLDTAQVFVSFDLVTRDSRACWGQPDEIAFDVTVVCRTCGQRARFAHGRTGAGVGVDLETFQCPCGYGALRLEFQFRGSSVLDVVDRVPVLGAAVRLGAAALARLAGGSAGGGDEHWDHAMTGLCPAVLQKQKLFGTHGALLKVAELLPGSNLVVALLHASRGRLEDASRALDLLQNWQDIGSGDGALAKLAEAVPGTDLLALALHLRAGSVARALRAATSERCLAVRVARAGLTLELSRRPARRCAELRVAGVQVGPSSRATVGALLCLLERLVGGAAAPDASEGPREADVPVALERLKEPAMRRLDAALAAAFAAVERRLPLWLPAAWAAACVPVARLRTRLDGPWRWLLPQHLAAPRGVLADQISACVAANLGGLAVEHHDALPEVEPVLVTKEDLEFAKQRLQGTWFFLLLVLFRFGFYQTAAFWCVLAVAAANADWPQRLHRLASAFASAVTAHNAKAARAWRPPCCVRPPLPLSPGRLGMAHALGQSAVVRGLLAEASGVALELPPPEVRELAALLRRYVLDQFWLPVRLALRVVECCVRALLHLLWPSRQSFQLVLPVAVPPKVLDAGSVPRWPFGGASVVVPAVELGLLLEVNLTLTGPLVLGCKVIVADGVVNRLTRELSSQASTLDLRGLGGGLSDFADEVRCSGALELRWPSATSLALELSGLATRLTLPATS